MRLIKNQIRKLLPLSLLLPLALGGCCWSVEAEPQRPAQVGGWDQVRQEGVTSVGEFLLTKASSVENAKVGIELREIIKGRTCRGTESVGPKAIVRLHRIPDQQTLVELELSPGNTRLINFNRSVVEDYGVDTIAVKGINTKDSWVWFELLD